MGTDRALSIHGLLLTGGTSTRMGSDKALASIAGVQLEKLAARALTGAADPVFVVGPRRVLGLRTVTDSGEGPLAALLAGWECLVAEGHLGPVLLSPCDLPFVTSELFVMLASHLGSAGAACPVSQGRDQPLTACYAPSSLNVLRRLRQQGDTSMRALLAAIEVKRIPESEWQSVVPAATLMDVDTPDELEAARRMAKPR